MIALAAAYLVALQTLLLPLSVAAGSPFAGSLCASSVNSSQQPDGQPNGHDGGCPCAAGCGMQCCVQALTGTQRDAVAPAVTPGYALTAPLHPIALARVQTRSPLIPRAPPAG
jgi:hypothetical protein